MSPFLSRAFAGAAVVALIGASTAEAQVGLTSNTATVTLNATRQNSITVSTDVATASLASITDNSTANNFSGVTVSTSWALTGGTNLHLVGWFGTPAQALSTGSADIPSSRVEGRLGAGAFAPFSGAAVGAAGVAGGSLTLYTQNVTGVNANGLRSDPLDLRLNLTGVSVAAGAYTGTLNLQAIVQ